MLPTLAPKDIVIFRPTNEQDLSLKEGCLVVVSHPLKPEVLMIKRIYRLTQHGFDLRGDNEVGSIDSRQFGLVNNFCLRGIVEQVFKVQTAQIGPFGSFKKLKQKFFEAKRILLQLIAHQ